MNPRIQVVWKLLRRMYLNNRDNTFHAKSAKEQSTQRKKNPLCLPRSSKSQHQNDYGGDRSLLWVGMTIQNTSIAIIVTDALTTCHSDEGRVYLRYRIMLTALYFD